MTTMFNFSGISPPQNYWSFTGTPHRTSKSEVINETRHILNDLRRLVGGASFGANTRTYAFINFIIPVATRWKMIIVFNCNGIYNMNICVFFDVTKAKFDFS